VSFVFHDRDVKVAAGLAFSENDPKFLKWNDFILFFLMLILFSFFCTVCVLCTHTPTHTHRDDATKDKKSLRMCGPREIHERRQRNDTLFLIYYFKGENSPLAGTPSILYRPDISPLSKCQIELKKIKKGEKKKDFFDFLHFASSLTLKREKKTV
jgi:hypothetical protein